MTDSRVRLQELRFHNPRLAKVGIEVLELFQLRDKASSRLLSSPRRVDFHHLLLVQRGSTKHMVDFVVHELRAGSVVFVRPGQVQQWRLGPGIEGLLVLIANEALIPSAGRADADMHMLSLPDWPVVSKPSRELFTEAWADIGRLAMDVQRFAGSDLEAGIIRHELLALLLRLARELRATRPTVERTREADIYTLFAKELEGEYTKRRSVLDYAERLGFSESTLTRASKAVVGRTAKEEIDRRVALEAKRLLVHSQATVAQIGYQLGFTEPTNFVKFFRRSVKCTPIQFRERHHGQ